MSFENIDDFNLFALGFNWAQEAKITGKALEGDRKAIKKLNGVPAHEIQTRHAYAIVARDSIVAEKVRRAADRPKTRSSFSMTTTALGVALGLSLSN